MAKSGDDTGRGKCSPGSKKALKRKIDEERRNRKKLFLRKKIKKR